MEKIKILPATVDSMDGGKLDAALFDEETKEVALNYFKDKLNENNNIQR